MRGLAVVLLLSCHPPAPAPRPSCPPCAPQRNCDDVLTEIQVERDICEAELRTIRETKVEQRTQTRTKVVAVEGPPKRCAGDGPRLIEVPATECRPGLRCLDSRGQAALATNLAAWAAWAESVRACERGE